MDSPATDAPAGPSPEWVTRINYYRAMAHLAPIRDVPDLSANIEAHARYLMTNFAREIRADGYLGPAAFTEDPARSGYSRDGASVAANSQIAWGCGSLDTDRQIDRWTAGPFHRLAMLDPALRRGGFGEASGGGCWAAGLRLLPAHQKVGFFATPVEFPPDTSTVPLDFSGGEFPNPAAGCPGHGRQTGLPITLQLGHVVEVSLGSSSLMEGSRAIEHCAFAAEGYRNPDPDSQEYGRWELHNNGAVVMIPRAPLRPGVLYKVSITANGKPYTWSFQTKN